MPNTAYTFDRDQQHHTMSSHPENHLRLHTAFNLLERDGLLGTLERISNVPAKPEDILRVHSEPYYEVLRESVGKPPYLYGSDTYITPDSFYIAQRAVGGLLKLTDAVCAGSVDNGFALVRPPGHHARIHEAMGFCLFANVAIAARHAQAVHGAERVMIVDFDVHHGNGTQEIFYEDPSVFFFSSHQYPFYPGSGDLTETGSGAGLGATMNVPLPPGVTDAQFLDLYRRTLLPAAERFRPDLLLVSAGFDAHHLDPIGELGLSVQGFADLVLLLLEIADRYCGGKSVFVLEGGYNVQALSHCVLTTTRLLQDPYALVSDPFGPPRRPAGHLGSLMEDVCALHHV